MAYKPKRYTSQLMHGLAALITNAGLAVYDPEQSYPDGVKGIYFDYSPPGTTTTPQESLTLTPYLPQSGQLAVEYTRIQFRARHVNRDPLEVRDWLDDVLALFPKETVQEIGGHVFDRIYQQASTSWGEPDRPGVLETTQNFVFRGNRYEP